MAKKAKKAVPTTGIETKEELAAISAAQEELLTEQAKEIEKLKAQVTTAAKQKRPVSVQPKTFKFEKKTYSFPAPKFRVPGFPAMTAKEALDNPGVLAKLVELQGKK